MKGRLISVWLLMAIFAGAVLLVPAVAGQVRKHGPKTSYKAGKRVAMAATVKPGTPRVKATGNRGGTPAKLTSISIQFHTNNDDKDHDSSVEVALDNSTYLVGKGTVGGGTRFPDNSDSQVYGIPVAGYYTPDNLVHGRLFVIIHPNGNDTWKFRVSALKLTYSDGRVSTISWGNTWVSEDDPQALMTW